MDTLLETETYKAHIYDVIGAIHEVHKELGPGLTEYCYQEGMQIQLEEKGVPFKREYFYNDDAKVIFGTDGNVKQFI